MVIYNFEFFCYFFRKFLNRVEYEQNSGVKFLSLFHCLSHPVLARNNPGKRFFNFSNFFAIFFGNILAGVQYELNWGQNFFSPFLVLSHPVLAKNNAGKRFFIILNFFAIFFGIFFRGPISAEFGPKIFFPTYLNPFWLEIFPERGFLIFWIFLLFFLEFSCRGPVWEEFGPKIFFFLSRPISSCFG